MDGVGLLLGSGFASGLSLYATGLLLGLHGRYLEPGSVPEVLTSTTTLWVLGALAVVELVVDKVPLVDSAWDTVHTVVRPVGAALLGLVLVEAGLVDVPFGELGGAGAAGGLALVSHGAKATTRAAVNTSPEPFSNGVVSLAEDGLVVGLVWLAVEHPAAAAVVVAALAVGAVAVTALMLRFVRRLRQRLRDRRRARARMVN